MNTPANTPVAPFKVDDLHDFTTHRANWRTAISHLVEKDNSGYWAHELLAYDRAMEAFDRAVALSQSTVTEVPQGVEGIHADAAGSKCPITGRPYFMHIEHPKLGLVPTYGGPFDSYTIPVPDGDESQKWHEREMTCERYDHDAGSWVDCYESVPLRIIHEDELFALEEAAKPTPPQPK